MMTNSRYIVIDNFIQGETVTYPLVILKGHLIECTHNCSEITKEEIYIKHNDYELKSNIFNNHFKIIIYLEEGSNGISLQYCCDFLEFQLEYIPRQTKYTVCPLYIICKGHDGSFQAPIDQDNSKEQACKRIDLISSMLQSVTAEKLYEKTLSRKTFSLENKCQIFYSNLNYTEAKDMTEGELWEVIGREIMKSSLGNPTRKYLGFLSCTRYCGEKYTQDMKSHKDLVNITESYVALGGGGLALFGSASFHTWPCKVQEIVKNFEDPTAIDRKKFLDDSCYRGTKGTCFSTSLGSVLHELSHTFDLGHSESGIMARGFDDIYKAFLSLGNNDHKITTKFHETIEFKESFEPKLLSERLKVQPKEYQITGTSKTEKDADDTFWTKSCATILNYHRWFNDFPENSTKYILKFDTASRAFTSTAGLRVVEIRRFVDEMVLMDWVFDGKILKYSFQIPINFNDLEDFENILIFAEDNVGNILKHEVPKSSQE